MDNVAAAILCSLEQVEGERTRRAHDPALAARVLALKAYQQRRFERSYADLLADPRYGPASRFFLEELYGPRDFSDRDAQFSRIVPALVRIFPGEVVRTVADLAELHALSERLDSAMATALVGPEITATVYVGAWQCTGQPQQRDRQINLMLAIGRALDRYTRSLLLRRTLRLMRRPAELAGLASLQRFLESGFDAFAGIRGASEFLAIIARRERSMAERLFDCDPQVDALPVELP